MRPNHASSAAHLSRRGTATALALILCLVAATPVTAAPPSASGKNAAVITVWNQIAVTTLANTVSPLEAAPPTSSTSRLPTWRCTTP